MASFDFVVAGSGAGGAAVASRLVRGGARVLLLEQGARAEPGRDALEAIYRYYAQGGAAAALGRALLPVPTGAALGGTTTINSGTCLRTPRSLLERWQGRYRGFSADDFERDLDEAWTALGVRQAPEATMSPSSRLFLAGLEALGLRGGKRLERAEDGCDGSGRCCFVCPTGAKRTADKAFLAPLAGDPRLVVALGSRLTSVRPGRRGARVEYRGPDGAGAAACAAVVLACGALATPYFARRFRLGDAPGAAGDGLSVHPAAKVFALFDRPLGPGRGVPQGAGLLDPEDDRIRYEGVQVPPELAAMTMPLDGARLREWMAAYGRVASFGFMIRDESRGRVRYPLGPRTPLVRYDLGDGDAERMVRAMKFLGRVFFAAGAKAVLLPLNGARNEFRDARELEAADLSGTSPARLQMMAFHPLGTCGIGRVVGADLRLADGVYVCDGAVVPESLGVNPQITIYAFALRLARRLLGASRESSVAPLGSAA